ncbi:hypothetical protein D3C87_1734750 [compost metagenome]
MDKKGGRFLSIIKNGKNEILIQVINIAIIPTEIAILVMISILIPVYINGKAINITIE